MGRDRSPSRAIKDAGLPPAVAALARRIPAARASRSCSWFSRFATSARRIRASRRGRCWCWRVSTRRKNAEPMIQRLEVVGKHAAPALYNAAQMKRVPLKFLWWPLAKVQEGLGGKAPILRRSRGRPARPAHRLHDPRPVPAADGREGANCSRVENQQHLRPAGRRRPRNSSSSPATRSLPGDPVAELYDAATRERVQRRSSRNCAKPNRKAATRPATAQRSDTRRSRRSSSLSIEGRPGPGKRIESCKLNMKALETRVQRVAGASPGWFVRPHRPVRPATRAARSEPRSGPCSTTTGPREPARPHRQAQRSAPRVGNVEGAWQVELKIPQRNIGQIMRAFTDPKLHKVERHRPQVSGRGRAALQHAGHAATSAGCIRTISPPRPCPTRTITTKTSRSSRLT